MGDSKSKKTITKLGKFFGVSSTNLSQLDADHAITKKDLTTTETNESAAVKSLSPLSTITNDNSEGVVDDDDVILSQQENDIVSPLPNETNNNNNNSTNINNSIHSSLKQATNSSSTGSNISNIGSAANTPNTIVTSSSNSSPKLTSSRSHTPVNHQNISSTTTSPLSLSSQKDSLPVLGAVTPSMPNFSGDPSILQPKPQSALDQNLHKLNLNPSSSSHNIVSTNEPTNASAQTQQPQIQSLSGRRASPSVSRSSSTHANSHPRKHANTISGPSNSKIGAVSRSSSTKRANGTVSSHPSSIDLNSQSPLIPAVKPRFRMLENGNHEHNLRSAKRQEKLSNMLKDLLGAKKLRDEARSEVPNILQGTVSQHASSQQNANEKPPTLFAGLVNHVKNNTSPYHTVPFMPSSGTNNLGDCRSFVEKYGRCQEVVGRGSFGVVRISHKKIAKDGDGEILYAVKEFKRRPSESDKKYNRRLTSEFCISSSLKNMNIIDTLDLLKDAKGDYCEVMEFCSGGDLYTLIIAAGKLEYAEADCFFKQIIRGVNYMHDMGVSHRDLKPENLLLTQNGVIKITDFGNGECFKVAWENEISLSEGICGSSPYIAPEEFTQQSFDPRCVDIWACGVIYMAMRTGRQLWKLADPTRDEFFEEYLVKRKDASGYEPIESLKRARCRNVIYSILDPKPERRITGKQILSSEWGREIKVCDAGEGH
ncbi:kinase domain-containing protein [Scheffersomyces xylosifermentans]|uniref:kinase domain-containing protein n=1 Tax=Scheffersomyces xylosifermentans TaxID=1304137 RepID=UPI00315D5A67